MQNTFKCANRIWREFWTLHIYPELLKNMERKQNKTLRKTENCSFLQSGMIILHLLLTTIFSKFNQNFFLEMSLFLLCLPCLRYTIHKCFKKFEYFLCLIFYFVVIFNLFLEFLHPHYVLCQLYKAHSLKGKKKKKPVS